jgi:hypothetical protein
MLAHYVARQVIMWLSKIVDTPVNDRPDRIIILAYALEQQ